MSIFLEITVYLPVTKAWLRQLILALVLIGHSPYRAVIELLRDLFDGKVSLGTVHNIVHSAVGPARTISRGRPLDGVRIGAHDEIFQAGHPVLVGVDTASTYCYLLSLEDHRDAETWGVRLLELVDRGFDPEATVADAGSGLRAGQALALPEVPCRGDLFHVLRDLEQVVAYLENRSSTALGGMMGGGAPNPSRAPLSSSAAPARPVTPRWPRPTRSPCCWAGSATTSSRWPGRATPTAPRCTTSWWPN